MKATTLLSFFLLLFVSAVPERVQAQSGFGIGGHVGYDVEFGNAFAGLQARIGVGSLPLVFQPGVEIPLNNAEYLWLEGNLLYMVGESYTNNFTPYFGAGLSGELADDYAQSETTLGINLIGGLQFGYGPGLAPFVQARYTVNLGRNTQGVADPLGISAGAIFRFGQ